ncbi:hypothetical protein BCR41DRAFT_371596 [Lobosporangium transversale]|uniref:Uncharacterized protein n=1 Tax=Lobosporangium transversale TaxID=64571 RepID=A0A1Y2GJJ4_9FUNG|nr:hypothetical protein BCR41DRAFT_371596 [Lobosporangium transversale]ORZ12898.1 hypothetical protein BCR41DRAFT_371596 [Lobosporangium transversale]|eukprot:XP_021880247.1 hypothetical protein BCR41DRAFT_371596 [Lobosporangium transversale]
MNLNDNKPCNTRAAYVTVLTAKNTTSTSTEPTTSMDNKDGAIPLQSIQDAYQKPLSKPNTLGSTPSSMSTAVSTEFEPSSTTTSPISHIRKWRSGLGGSSKKQQKKRSHSSKGSSGKARAIGPISGPLPLTMPAPFVCTPLPYSDAPIIVSPTTLTNLKAATFLDMSSSPTPSKPTTSCLDLPIGSQSSNPVLSLASVNEQSAAYSDMESYRTSWKGRLFYATRDMLAPFQVEPLSHLSETESHQLPIDVSDQSVIDALHSSVQEDRDHTDDKDNEEHQTQDRRDSGEDNDATKDFALSLCQGFGSDFDLSPSNFDYQSICRDQGNDFHLQTEDNREIEKIRPRWSRTLKQIRPKSSSTISTSSDSSTESVDSINSSSSASLGKLGLSQMSSVNGISSMTTRSVPDVTSSRSSPTPSTTLKKSRAMRFSASLTNLLPISLSKDKGSTPTMPPASLPVEHEHDKSQENIDEQSSLKPTRASYMDPRAITLKRLAYIHTLKKLREREKRPFHHAVLLHMMLHQLRKAGISARQCDEIGAYYTTLEATQLSTRWDIENMAVALTAEQQQQEDTLPKQKHHQYLDAMDHTQLPQQQAQELSSLPKMNSTKKQKLRHPLVSSKNHLQSKPPNTTSDNDSDRNDASSMMGSCQHLPPQAPLSSGSVLLPATPYKMPLHPTLRMPAQPLINLDMKNTPSTTTTTPASVRKDAAMRAPTFTPPVSSDSESEDEGADGLCTEEKYDEGHDKEANEAFPSTPKVYCISNRSRDSDSGNNNGWDPLQSAQPARQIRSATTS